jgi:ParB family chromosome partitioning protein
LFEIVKHERLNVRQTEELVRRAITGSLAKKKGAKKQAWDGAREYESKLRNALGTKVMLQRSRKGGKIVIEFYSDEEFSTLYDKIVGPE